MNIYKTFVQFLFVALFLTTSGMAATVGNQVWIDTNNDGIQSGTEASGVPGVQVNLLMGGGVVATQTTGANGNFLFQNVAAGAYEVQVVTPANLQVGTPGTGNLAGPNGVVSNLVLAANDNAVANVGLA